MITRYLLTGLFLLALVPGSTFVFYVHDADGAPLAGVTFTVQDADGQRRMTTTDAQGHARLENLPGQNVRILGATYQGRKLTLDSSNGPDQSGLTIPLIVGGEQRFGMEVAGDIIGPAFQQPPPAAPFPTDAPTPTRTPRPTPSPTPTDTLTPSLTEAPTTAPTEVATASSTATPASSPTPALVAAAPGAPGGTDVGNAPGSAPVAAAAPADPLAAEPAPTPDRTRLVLLVLGVLAVVGAVGAVGYGVWGRRRPS